MASNVEIAGRGRFATLIARLFRWPVVLLTLAVLAALLWSGLYPWVTQRHLTLDLTVENAGLQWSLEWVRQSNGARNGAWLEVRDPGAHEEDEEKYFEIRPAGVSSDNAGADEVWLGSVVPLDTRYPALDLKRIIAAAEPEDMHGPWRPATGREGIVYCGPASGLLRMSVPPGGLRLFLSSFLADRDVTVSYADCTETLELRKSVDPDGARGGLWVDLPDTKDEWLEIRPSGVSRSADGAFEVWFYNAFPFDPRHPPLDLKAIIATADPEDKQGSWVPNLGGAGIVYYGPGPGLLRMRAPEGGIQLHLARLPVSGEVTVTYANDTQTLDLAASSFDVLVSSFSRRVFVARSDLSVEQTLPNYDLGRVALKWIESDRATFSINSAMLTERVFGIPVRRRALEPEVGTGARLLDQDGDRYGFETTVATGSIPLCERVGLGTAVLVSGYVITLLCLACAYVVVLLVRQAPWGRVVHPLRPAVIGVLLVILVRTWLAAWSPLFVSYDGVQYISNAQTVIATGGTESLGGGGFRMPGYSLMLIPFIKGFHDFGSALVVFQALLGIAVALLCYAMLKQLMPSPWPVLGLVYIGLDPVLLTYEHFALTECLSVFCVTLIAWLTVRRARVATGTVESLPDLADAIILGLLCGLSAYVRSSLQVLLVVVPFVILVMGWHRGIRKVAIMRSAVVACFGIACLLPWIARNYALLGQPKFAPFGDLQRIASFWDAGALDLNQTPAYTLEQWQEIHSRGYFTHTQLGPLLMTSDLPTARGHDLWPGLEIKSRFLLEEAAARRPLNVLRGGLVAFCNQIGLWNKLDQHHSGRENIYWSRALRGDPWSATNLFSTSAVQDFEATQDRLPDIERDIKYLHGSPNAMWFNDYFFAYETTRPIVAVFFLLGLGLALYNRCYAVGAVGVIAVAHAAAMAIVVLSAIDRYAVPFKPLIAVVAVYALYRLASGRNKRSEGLNGK